MVQPYKMNNFSRDLERWMNARFLPTILTMNGGWEYWIQIDFPAYLDIMYEAQIDFQREIWFADEQRRIDWIINGNVQGATPVAMEIKAQTKSYLTRDLIRGVEKDIGKLENLDGDYRRYMLCAVIDPAAQEALEAMQFTKLFLFADNSGAYYWKPVAALR